MKKPLVKCSTVRKPNQKVQRENNSSRTCDCDLCDTVVKRRDILYHYFKVHDLPYEEAVKKVPQFKVSLSKIVRSCKGRNSKKVQSADHHMLHCDLCDTVLNKRYILMHLYKLHGLSYQEAVQKISGFKERANKRRQGSSQLVAYLLRNKTAKTSSPAKGNIEAETKTEKRRTRQRKTKVNSRRRKLQPSQITKDGEPMIKVAYVKLEKVDCDEQLENYEEHTCRDQRTECNERRMNKSPEKAPQGTPIADESQDEVVTEITRESRGKDIGVVPKEDGHNEPNQELEESVESDHDKQSGKSIPIPLAEDACTNIIDQSEVWQVTVDTIVKNEERDEMIDPDQMRRDNDSLEEHVREDSDMSIQEEGNKVSENIASPQNTISIHVDKEETVIENEEEPTGAIEGEGPFPCEICGQCFNSQGLVQDHLVTVHFQCTTCCKTFKNKRSLRVHIGRHKNQANGVIYTCSVCQKSFLDKTVHESHVKMHSTKKEECKFCNMKFCNVYSLGKHINRIHTQKNKYSCNQCDRYFFVKCELERHVNRTHAREMEWKCDECGKIFYNETDLTRHKKVVHNACHHLCELCGASFKSKSILAQHHLTVHTDIRKFTCEICGKSFKRSSNLYAHRKVHTDFRPVECKICGKGFRIQAKLQVHMNWHNNVRSFACTMCSKTFLTKGNLVKHQTVHTKIYKHSCEHCGRGFPDFSQLRHHLSKAHDIIIASKITKGKRELSVQSKADSQITALVEHQTQSRLSAENEPQSSATAPDETQCLRTAQSVSKAGVVTDCDTLVHSSPVIAVTSEASGGDDNLLATEALVAMMHSHGIQ